MKQIRPLLSSIAMLLCSTTLSAQTFEVDGICYNVTDQAAMTVEVTAKEGSYYSAYKGDITIPASVTSEGATYSVTAIGTDAFAMAVNLNQVVIPNTVTLIADGAFSTCTGMSSITLPASLTTIGSKVFTNCMNLTAITIPAGVTRIGKRVFSACASLERLTVDPRNTVFDSRDSCNAIVETATNTLVNGTSCSTIPASVTTIGEEAFGNCTSLTAITIPDNVTVIGEKAFSGCKYVETIDFSENLTTIGDEAFEGCMRLTAIELPNSLTQLGVGAFTACQQMTSVTFPQHLTTIPAEAFRSCIRLTSVTIPAGVDTIGDQAFIECYGMAEINLSEGLLSIGDEAFAGNNEVTTVTIPASVTHIGSSPFMQCGMLSSIVVNAHNSVYDSRNNCNAIVETATNTLLQGCNETVIPAGIETIGDAAFYGCSDIGNIAIPSSVRSIGDAVFFYCTNLNDLRLEEGLLSIGDEAFYNIGIPDLHIPSTVTHIGTAAFSRCKSLGSITVDPRNSVYDSRNNCNAIVETATNTLLQGCNKTVIPADIETIGEASFNMCMDILSIVIPDKVTRIGKQAFAYCENLVTVTFPQSLKTIGYGAFYSCDQLRNISLPNSVDSIGDEAFMWAPIDSLTIGSGVRYIGEYAFGYCETLYAVNSLSTQPDRISLHPDAFYASPLNKVTLYVPAGTKSLYQTTDVWKDFGNIVEKTATAIDQLTAPQQGTSPVYYNLDGRRVVTPTKGIHIVNGRKVLIR